MGLESSDEGCESTTILSTVTKDSCVLSCELGFESTGNSPLLKCGLNGGAATTEFACQRETCVPISLNTLTTGVVGTNDESGCVEGQILNTSQECSIGCIDSFSYVSGNATIRCGLEAGLPINDMICEERVCERFYLSEGMEGDEFYDSDIMPCYNGIQLGAHTLTQCALRCADGYASEGDDPLLRCGTDGSIEFLNWTCTEKTCEAWERPTEMQALGINGCEKNATLSAISRPSCDLQCANGYDSNGLSPMLMCSLGGGISATALQCTEKTCVPISLPQGVVGTDGETGCTEGQVLSTVTNRSCEVRCKDTHSWDSGATNFTCGIDGGSAYSSISCSENHCNSFLFSTGMIGDTNVSAVMPCYDGVVLSAENQNTCAVKCTEGFTANENHSNIVSCPIDGGDAVSNIFCSENVCESYTFPVGMASDECSTGIMLSSISDPTCNLKCEDAYISNGELSLLSCGLSGGLPFTEFACSERRCSPLFLPEGIEGAGEVPCADDMILSTVTNSTCGVQCSSHFSETDSSVSSTVRCLSTGGSAVVTLECVQNSCNSFTFQPGVEGSTINDTVEACSTEFEVLSLNQCGIKCREGWYDPENVVSDETVTCPQEGGHVDVPKLCEPYECVSTNVENSDKSSLGSIQGATDDVVSVTCLEGYSGGGNVECMSNGRFTNVTCEPNPCISTQVQNSDRAAPESIVGATGDTVQIICDYGYCVKGNDCLFRSAEATCEVDGRFSLPVCIESPDETVVVGIETEFQNTTFVTNHKEEIGTKIADVLCDNLEGDIKVCQFVSMDRIRRRRRRESDFKNRRLLFSTSWSTTVDVVFQGDANPDVLNDMLSSEDTSFQNILEEELTDSFENVGSVSVSNVNTIQIEDPDSNAENIMILVIAVAVAVFSLLCVLLMFCFGCGLYHGMKKAPINTVIPGTTVELVQEDRLSNSNIPTATPIGEIVNSTNETPVIDLKTGGQYRAHRVSKPLMAFIKKARRSFVTYSKKNGSKNSTSTSKDAWL